MNENSIVFLRDSLTHHYGIRNALDQKAAFLVGISGVIFSLSVGRLNELNFLVLAIGSFISALISVSVVILPFRGKFKERLGLMCWWGFSDKNFKEYQEGLKKVFVSDEQIAQEYMIEIWNLANYSIKPKNMLLKWSALVLVLGLFAGFILFFV